MLKNGRVVPVGSHNGCSCCNSKRVRRAGKKAARAAERRGWQKDAAS
jgi:hypothetical protein